MTVLQAELSPSQQMHGDQAYPDLSLTEIRQLFSQVESDFYQSQLYQKAGRWLRQRLPGEEDLISQLLGTLGQEAVRLTLQRLSARSPGAAAPQLKADPQATGIGTDIGMANPFTPLVEDPTQAQTAPAAVASGLASPVASPKEPPAADTAAESQPTTLADVGCILRQARQAKGLTVEQLHQLTHVPRPHIRAIEEGASDRLPEQVYIRGFVRHMSRSLEVDAAPLLKCLAPAATPRRDRAGHQANRYSGAYPMSSPTRSSRPSGGRTRRSSSKYSVVPAGHLRPAHLYVGYATLMAGAVGSLCWVTWQPMVDQSGPAPMGQDPMDLDQSRLDQSGLVPNRQPSGQPSVARAKADRQSHFIPNVASPQGKSVPAKLRHFQLSKQRSRRLVDADAIAVPELILSPLQALQTLKSQ